MNIRTQNRAPGLASLRRLIERPRSVDRCELCSANLGDAHQHLIEPPSRRLLCACDACALLFPDTGVTQYRRVPRDIYELGDFQATDAFWSGLSIPIALVFLFRSSSSHKIVALYPSPAGATESEIDEEAWAELAAENPALANMRPDVEGLLVNRLKNPRQHYIAPIDECFRLAGLIRKHWHGLSGGEQAWREIGGFFADLRRRSRPRKAANRA
jgi:hypothetical protein